MDINKVVLKTEGSKDLFFVYAAGWDTRDLKIWEDRDGVDLFYLGHRVEAAYVQDENKSYVLRCVSTWNIIDYFKKHGLVKVLKHPPKEKALP